MFFNRRNHIWDAGGHLGGGRFLANLNDNSSINTVDSLSFKSGLDPENDPVVFTTDYGLDIHYANDLTNSNLAGYTYFTMGEYDGTPVNWVIVGYDPSMHDFVGDFSGKAFRDNPIYDGNQFTQFDTVDGSSAGMAILKDIFAISDQAVTNFEIGTGCILCLSEYCLFNTKFSSGTAYYNSSYLITHMSDLFTSSLNIDDEIKQLIIPQNLTTTPSDVENVCFFPFAYSVNESFWVETYLPTSNTRLGYNLSTLDIGPWWLRSSPISGAVAHVNSDGSISGGCSPTYYSFGVRPAFVLEL